MQCGKRVTEAMFLQTHGQHVLGRFCRDKRHFIQVVQLNI